MSAAGALGWQHGWQAGVAFAVAFVAGTINAIAGGGSILTFPTLIALGLPPILANATNTVAVWPASVSSAWGFRRELRTQWRRWLWLALPSLLGGIGGAALLLHTRPRTFERLAPWLVLAATLLIACEPLLRRLGAPADGANAGATVSRRGRARQSMAPLLGAQFAIALYGGYFGIGIGLLMLGVYGLSRLGDIRFEIAVKNACATAINGAAVVYFVLRGIVVWHAALTMGAGALAGGVVGAALARRLSRNAVRWTVVAIGVAMTVALLAR